MLDYKVTGVQTCALPICGIAQSWDKGGNWDFLNFFPIGQPYIVSYDMAFPYSVCAGFQEIGRASCRERDESLVVAVSLEKNVNVAYQAVSGGADTAYDVD